jgi:hypothetical protein
MGILVTFNSEHYNRYGMTKWYDQLLAGISNGQMARYPDGSLHVPFDDPPQGRTGSHLLRSSEIATLFHWVKTH